MQPVSIRGDGVAAYCCEHLLRRAGVPVSAERPSRARVPAIMLSEAAVALIADVFGHANLFRDVPRVRSRSVLWGPNAEPVTLPHSAIVVSEEMLLDRLRPAFEPESIAAQPAWHVYASRPLPPESRLEGFGTRVARAHAVRLRAGRGPGCWAESTGDGWLFLVGGSDGTGWLLSIGGPAASTLERSRLVVDQIADLGEASGEFPSFPRIMTPLCGAGWLACGTAAIGFDPICGDGTAHAVREAILAVAVIRAISAGAPADPLFAHYQARLIAGFHRHLASCEPFYRSGGQSPWWAHELQEIQRGMSWCSARLAEFPPFRYRLNGYELEAVA